MVSHIGHDTYPDCVIAEKVMIKSITETMPTKMVWSRDETRREHDDTESPRSKHEREDT